jgi:AraC-like DNA-binding protein
MQIDGSGGDLEGFGRGILRRSFSIEAPSPSERRISWDQGGSAGTASSARLRSGMLLSAATFRWEQAPPMAVDHAPSSLEFVLSRGPLMHIENSEGERYQMGGGRFQVGQVKRPLRMTCGWGDEARGGQQEHICLGVDRGRLLDLLGAPELPGVLGYIDLDPGAYPRDTLPMSPALFRLLDEITHCDARGLSRQLFLEAKGLELLASLIEQIEEGARAVSSPPLSPDDADRLERARQILLASMTDPPSIPALARRAGLNEAKLKAGFRALFGDSIFGYLRRHRMDEAHRLLRLRRSVSEVARLVGYENPSKFASAFRKQFGVSPSSVR